MVFLLWTRKHMTAYQLPTEHTAKEIHKKILGMPMETMFKLKIVRETLKAKGYDLDEVETGKVTVGEDLRRLLERLADDKPMVSESGKDRPEVTILKRGEEKHDGDSMKKREPEKRRRCEHYSRESRKKY